MSITSAARKTTSRIYQDLRTARFHCVGSRNMSIMDRVLKVFGSRPKKVSLHEMSWECDALQNGRIHVLTHPVQLETLNPSRRPHVGVIGAGFAGLKCADVLLRNGFRVTILEARNRLGGRIYQERLPNGHLVDVGANWIHGTTDNPIMDLVKETKTAVGVWDNHSCIYDEDGTLLSAEEGEKFSTLMWNIIEDAFEYSNKHGSEIDPQKSLGNFFQEQVVERIPDSEEGFERARHILLQMAELWGNFVGSPLSTQSLKFFWLEECIEGGKSDNNSPPVLLGLGLSLTPLFIHPENLFCAGTYSKVLEKVAQPAIEGAAIHYQTQVAEIHGKSTGPNGTVRIRTTDDRVFEFDEVVVTCPLGWLKQNLQAFSPPLPDRVEKAIQNIGYGSLEKVSLPPYNPPQ